MKILHTADWHLGHRLFERSQKEEQVLFLEWLKSYVTQHGIDVLLISGDIFDTASPSPQQLKMYYDFLIELKQTKCQNIIITGGNHDSPGIINAPQSILNSLSIQVVGRATDEIEDEVFKIKIDNDELIVAAVPYLRDKDIRKAVSGETFDNITNRYKKALINHYDLVAAYCEKIQTQHSVCLSMGHLFAMGGQTSDSEQNIYVGSLGHINASDFPNVFDYIALGHLHRPQIVGGLEHIRYSGSPIILSMSEINYDKNVIVIETKQNEIENITNVKVPKFRQITRVSGAIENCQTELQNISTNDYNLKPWVEVVLNRKKTDINSHDTIRQFAENLPLEILGVRFDKQAQVDGIDKHVEDIKVKDLSPLKVFELKCENEDFSLKDNPDILDAFSEALQIAKNQ